MTSPEPSAASPPPRAADLSRRNVEGLFAMRPLQQALLFPRRSESDDPGFIQVKMTLEGEIDPTHLRAAWQEALDCHEALRMSVHTADSGTQRIVSWRSLPLPWRLVDWRGEPTDEVARRRRELLEQDRRERLDVASPPVMRLTAVRLDGERTDVLWSCHHLFLDGWSTALIIDDVLRRTRALAAGHATRSGPPAPYRRYVAWLQEQDHDEAARFWREQLAGFAAPPPLVLRRGDTPDPSPGFDEVGLDLDVERTQRLERAGTEHQLTANALLQGAWALVLGRLLGSSDVVFGTTVSGRGAPVPGMESMIGLFANVLPVRVRLDAPRTVRAWLTELRDTQFAVQAHEHCDLGDIQAWTGASVGRSLFDTLLVVENFPWQGADEDELRLVDYGSDVTSVYPLTLTAVPGATWRLAARFDRQRIDAGAAEQVLELTAAVLDRLAARPDADLAEVTAWLADLGGEATGAVSAAREAARAEFVEPVMASEVQLAHIWEEALGVSPVGLHDDFFELGGRSVTAVRVFGQIEEVFGKRLPLTMILEHPTLAGLARMIMEADAGTQGKPLVALRSTGSRTPLCFVHGGAEEAFLFRGVARHLGADQPVYVCQAPARDDGTAVPTVEQLATDYLRELRAVQPEGPYQLVGYCFGGTMCFEMARQLMNEGETIRLLAVMDAPPPLLREPPGVTQKVLRLVRKRGILEAGRMCARYAVRWPLQKIQPRWARSFGTAQDQRFVELDEMRTAFRTAYLTYRPDPLDIPVTMIRSEENDWLDDYAPEDWQQLTSRVETHVVPAGHVTMLIEPAVRRVAEAIAAALEGRGTP